eukprot:SAG11_NODE_803_length_7098_cov_10.219174_3_plen_133_part_00
MSAEPPPAARAVGSCPHAAQVLPPGLVQPASVSSGQPYCSDLARFQSTNGMYGRPCSEWVILFEPHCAHRSDASRASSSVCHSASCCTDHVAAGCSTCWQGGELAEKHHGATHEAQRNGLVEGRRMWWPWLP